MIPGNEFHDHWSDIYSHYTGLATVIPLNTDYLKEILRNSPEKLLMLWKNVSPRQIIIQHKKIPEIEAMNREKIKNLCLMCDHKIY